MSGPTWRSRKTQQRRGYAIHGYTGSNGAGKSLAMVSDTMLSLAAGRLVLSTVRLLDWIDPHLCGERVTDHCDDPANHDRAGSVHPAAHPCYVPLREYSQVVDAEHCDILFDEVTGVASSRDSHSMPMQITNKLVQLRRADCLLRWSTPNWARSDKVIREVTQAVTECHGMFPVVRTAGEGEAARMWRDRRLFRWCTYDASEFEEWTMAKRDKVKKICNEWHWRPRGDAHSAYDTMDSVNAVGWPTEAGNCMACGGHRARPKCACPTVAHEDSASCVVVGEAGKPAGVAAGVPRSRLAPRSERLRLSVPAIVGGSKDSVSGDCDGHHSPSVK